MGELPREAFDGLIEFVKINKLAITLERVFKYMENIRKITDIQNCGIYSEYYTVLFVEVACVSSISYELTLKQHVLYFECRYEFILIHLLCSATISGRFYYFSHFQMSKLGQAEDK